MTKEQFRKLVVIINDTSYRVTFEDRVVRIVVVKKDGTFDFLCSDYTDINNLTLEDISIEQFRFDIVKSVPFDEINI